MNNQTKEIIKEKIIRYLIDQGHTEQQIEEIYNRALKGRKDKVLQLRLSLYDYLLIKENPAKMIRFAIRKVYGIGRKQ